MSTPRITDVFQRGKQSTRTSSKQHGKSVPLCVPSTSSGESLDDSAKLRQFDLDWRYGPCSGITRLERWERANKQNLNPPQEVKDLVLSHVGDIKYVKSVWHGYEL